MAVSHGSASNPNVEEGTVSAIRSEIDATTERADRLAREGAPEGADVASMLAGLISQLSEQVGRLSDRLLEDSARPTARQDQGTEET